MVHHWSNTASVLHHNVAEVMYTDFFGTGTQWLSHDKDNLLLQKKLQFLCIISDVWQKDMLSPPRLHHGHGMHSFLKGHK